MSRTPPGCCSRSPCIDAAIIGAAAVGLSTAYAIADVLGLKHSLHRKPGDAKGFYVVFGLLMAIAATIVLIPGSPLGLLTVGVQTLAGVLLPSAVVFLLLLCNDREVLGPWANGPKLNVFTSAVIAILVVLSIILTASVLFPKITGTQILAILIGGMLFAILAGMVMVLLRRRRPAAAPIERAGKDSWRMPPLALLTRPEMSNGRRIGLTVLRAYLLVAMILVIVRVVQLALGK